MKFYLAILFISAFCLSCSYRISPPDKHKYSWADTIIFKIKDKKQKIDSVYVTSEGKRINGKYSGGKYSVLPSNLYPGANRLSVHAVLINGRKIKKDSDIFIVSDVVPKKYLIRSIEELPHDTSAFTQGLAFHKGLLYESTGIKGKSRLRIINPDDGSCFKDTTTDINLFNEGISIINDTLYQLTWKDSVLVIRNPDFSEIRKLYMPLRGWGLCANNSMLYISDGTNKIVIMDSYTLTFTDTIRVIDNKGPLYYLNELEWVDGHVWANIYGKDIIAVINPGTGKVIATLSSEDLIDRKLCTEAGVMNGIAYDPKSKRVYLTGKNWPFIKVCNSYFGK